MENIPPQNIEAEQSVLGALLLSSDAIVEVAEVLKPHHFYREEQHGTIYSCMIDLYERREPIDVITLTEELRKREAYDLVGGSAYLAMLASVVPTAANVVRYAKIVKDHFTKRELISSANRISEMAQSPTSDVASVLDQAEQLVFHLSQEHTNSDFVPIRDTLAESFDRLDDLHKNAGKLRGVPTGFRDVDNKLAGLQDSALIVLAARPGTGKTAFALNIAQNAAIRYKIPVGYFSLEMSKEELTDRLLSIQSLVDGWNIKTGRLEESDWEKLQDAMGELAEAPLYIDDTPGLTIMEMRTKARRLQMEKGLKLLIVDYLQLARGRTTDNRVQEVSEISQGLKNLARELRIPVLALSQLSRAVESRTSKAPQLSDLRESGAIEQDADVVMFLYKEDIDNPEFIKLGIAKHRSGAVGDIDLIFKGARQRFYGVDKKKVS
ncbi:MAG: replicative DNA helicase [bacterium]|nr:replicative DNA helicase [bacterium]